MTIEILMPALSPTMEEGTLAKWLKEEGDEISAGDIIAEIETDKATMEFEAVEEGKLGKIVVPEGTEGVKVNDVIAILLEEGEDEEDAEKAAESAGGGDDGAADEAEADADDDQDEGDGEKQAAQKGGEEKAAQKGNGRDRSVHTRAVTIRDDAQRFSGVRVPDSRVGEPDWPEGTEMVEQTVREALRDAVAEEMRRDEDVFIIGEEVGDYEGAYKITQGILDEFGERRVVDTPITEYGFCGVAVGAAFAGLRPIQEFMTWNFAMQAIDHIVNSAAKTLYMSGGQMGCPIVFRGPNGAAARVAAQHSQDYAAWYAHVPGLKVIQPYSAADAKGLLKAAVRDPNPVIFLENEILYGKKHQVPKLDDYTIEIGKAKIWREGNDCTVVSWGIGMTYALEAAQKVADEDGIDVEVVDLRTIRPMDRGAVIRSVMKTNRCVTVEEAFPVCSVSNHISSFLMTEAFDYLDAPVINVTGKDVPMPYAENLERLALTSTEEVVEAIRTVCYR